MSKILVKNIRVYAYHGCMDEEGVVGGNYRVDVWVEANTAEAEKSDNLKETIDYVVLYNIVVAEMAVRSKLIEHVGRRIAEKIKIKYPTVTSGEVIITKLNPPIKGVVGAVSAAITI